MNARTAPRTRAPRSDGEQSRLRLLHAALELFAQRGYAKTSTREIAEAAGVNLAAISYYFGDKQGLYRAAFFDLQDSAEAEIARYAGAQQTLREALRGLYRGFVAPLQQGDTARLAVKLRAREMVEPTGLWQEEIEHGILPMHKALVRVLCRHLGLRRADADMHRLAICVAALGVQLHVCSDVNDVLAPGLARGAKALDVWLDRLVVYAEAMVEAERARRAGAAA